MEQKPTSSKTADRKTIEKNRRNLMKILFSELISLIPHRSREASTLVDQIEAATNYIKKTQIKLEKMKERRDCVMRKRLSSETMATLRLPRVDIRESGSALEVVLITGSDCQFMFAETIRLLHEEGVEVVNASFSVLDDTIFHTIHSKIGESAPCNAAGMISDRLKKLVYGDK